LARAGQAVATINAAIRASGRNEGRGGGSFTMLVSIWRGNVCRFRPAMD
jgi:hypothetical protein